MKSIISRHFIIYKIDLANHGSTLITIGWFKDQGENIKGGNSRVLVDAATSKFYIYPTGLVNMYQ